MRIGSIAERMPGRMLGLGAAVGIVVGAIAGLTLSVSPAIACQCINTQTFTQVARRSPLVEGVRFCREANWARG
jgi:hypothetical protein